ncbi:UDP-glucoronosyl and UDP-glucosyl transferase [Popillia japonica]|uniref:UDP-glucuronosyltransferase n=1 Tax=Popillia japonica TaxID=7064 RepID=A0AAW1LSH8_POPJA
MRTIIIVTSLYLFAICADAVKILCVFPMVSYSHHQIGHTLMKELAKRGHEITFVSPFPEKEPIKNFKTVVLTGLVEEANKILATFNPLEQKSNSVFFNIIFLTFMTSSIMEQTLAHENLHALLRSGEKYDIVLTERFAFDGLLVIGQQLNVPYGLISCTGPSTWTNHLVGAPDIPSYLPSLAVDPPVHTSFTKRLYNFILYVYSKLFERIYSYPKQDAIVKKYFPDAPHIYDIIYNTSLILFNSDNSFNQPIPTTANSVEIGGFHVRPPKKLPEDLQKILDNAKHGVVYFSLGSVVKSSLIPVEKRQEILRALSKLKETVLWKFEEDLPNLPPNVIIKSWFPQSDLLAHPNVKVFITHGGLLSTIESLHRGVPVIGIPVFGDQKMNMANAVNQGHGLMIPYPELSEETLSEALKDVLTNPEYRNNVKYSSAVLKDQLVDPIDKAEYWIKYVIRHKGVKHLRLASMDLTWYQHVSLDVILFLTAVTVILFYVFYRIIKSLLGRRKSKKQKVN